MSKPIRKRSAVAAEFTWDLTDIFPSDEAWRAEYEALKPYAEAVAAYQGRLGESAETLLAYFRLDDELNVRVGRLYGYANCKADEDTSNGFYQDLRGKALNEETAREALRLAMHKLPIKCKFVKKETEGSEE